MINITKVKRYFAYGSNMDERQMLERCPQSEKQEIAELTGYEFFINKRGVANIRPKKGKRVWGIIYNITEDDEEKLDKFEGVKYGTNIKDNSALLNVFYYVAKETNEGQPREEYLEKITESAEAHNFPEEYIAELKRWSK